MKNRDWITSMCIYDFLCHLNVKDIRKCVVTLCNKEIDKERCVQYNRCCYYLPTNKCNLIRIEDFRCDIQCTAFSPNCEKCIAEYLSEERRNDLCKKLF